MKKINLGEFIQKTGNRLAMTDAERGRIQHVLSEYMHMKPMRNAPLERRAPFSFFLISMYAYSRKSVAFLLLFALLLSGAGVSYAAENALPTDFLYPFKTEVNEEIVAAVSVSVKAKAEWNAERAERRLEEAAALASGNRLDEVTEANLLARFESHAAAAVSGVEALEEEDASVAAELASSLETRLAAHDVILADIESGKAELLRGRLREKALAVAEVRGKAEGNAAVSKPLARAVPPVMAEASLIAAEDASPMRILVAEESDSEEKGVSESDARIQKSAVLRMEKSARKSLEEMKKLFSRVEGKLTSETALRVQNEMARGEGAFSDGETFVAAENYPDAFHAYQQALVISQKLSVYLKAFLKFRIRAIPALGEWQKEERVSESRGENERPDGFEIKAQFQGALPPSADILPAIANPAQTQPPEEAKKEDDNKSGDNTEDGVEVEIEGVIKVRPSL